MGVDKGNHNFGKYPSFDFWKSELKSVHATVGTGSIFSRLKRPAQGGSLKRSQSFCKL